MTTKLPKLNVRLLNRIKRHLTREPKRYNQSRWGQYSEGPTAPACHTQGCIAGWAVFLSVPKSKWRQWMRNTSGTGVDDVANGSPKGIPRKAKALLGLTHEEAYKLFAAHNQTNFMGTEGVAEATRKIDDLITDRASFVTKW